MAMDVLRDPPHIGMFEPHDLDILKGVFTRLTSTGRLDLDEARTQSLARSILALYRYGVRDPERLFDVLQMKAS